MKTKPGLAPGDKLRNTPPTRPIFSAKEKVGELTFLVTELKRLHTEGVLFVINNEEQRAHRYTILGEKPEMHHPAGGHVMRLRELVECKSDIVSNADLLAILKAGQMYVEAGEEIAAGISKKIPNWRRVSNGHIRHVLSKVRARYGGRQMFFTGQGIGRAARA